MKMEKFVSIPMRFALLVTVAHALILDGMPHHKVRHKHNNALHFDNRSVNEIREAFVDYKRTVEKKPRVSFEEATAIKPLRHHRRRNDERLSDELTPTVELEVAVNDDTQIARSRGDNRQLMTRYKRVHTTEASTSPDEKNYDEEYSDNDDDGDESGAKKSQKVQETETAAESLTELKFNTLGTREGVRQSFEHELRQQQDNRREIADNYDQASIVRMIHDNMRRTKIDGLCRWPGKRVIEMPKHASKMYTPRKYVIYQCSDDTACCKISEETCVAKRVEEVQLWFNVRYVGSTGYESLKVQNHTECECLRRNRIGSHAGPTRVSHALPKTRARSCNCPTFFSVEHTDGACGCFCRMTECQRRFEGREGFTMSDQRCITRRDCSQPHCLFGTYSPATGRCPDRHEKMRRGFDRPKKRESRALVLVE